MALVKRKVIFAKELFRFSDFETLVPEESWMRGTVSAVQQQVRCPRCDEIAYKSCEFADSGGVMRDGVEIPCNCGATITKFGTVLVCKLATTTDWIDRIAQRFTQAKCRKGQVGD